MEAVGEQQGAGLRTSCALLPSLGCKVYQRARSELVSPPRRWRGRGRLQQKRPSAVVMTGESWQKEIAACPPGTLPSLIRTKQESCGKVSNWNGAGPWVAFLEETPPHREIT